MTLLPDINPENNHDHQPVAETDIPNLTATQKAEMMEQGFNNFVQGNRTAFKCYFMLEDPHHNEIRDLFTRKLGILTEAEAHEGVSDAWTVVLANTDVALIRQYNTYDDGTPYDVTYFGIRSEESTPTPSVEV